MKELKFRFWDGKYMEMPSEQVGLYRFEEMGITHVIDGKGNAHYGEQIVMQYTGLKDKNGVDMYDGDIIKNHQAEVNIIHWYGNGWHYQNYHANSLPLDDLWNPYDDKSNEQGDRFTGHEIIGNIHENPELLIK